MATLNLGKTCPPQPEKTPIEMGPIFCKNYSCHIQIRVLLGLITLQIATITTKVHHKPYNIEEARTFALHSGIWWCQVQYKSRLHSANGVRTCRLSEHACSLPQPPSGSSPNANKDGPSLYWIINQPVVHCIHSLFILSSEKYTTHPPLSAVVKGLPTPLVDIINIDSYYKQLGVGDNWMMTGLTLEGVIL